MSDIVIFSRMQSEIPQPGAPGGAGAAGRQPTEARYDVVRSRELLQLPRPATTLWAKAMDALFGW